jgi:hypothetical protein
MTLLEDKGPSDMMTSMLEQCPRGWSTVNLFVHLFFSRLSQHPRVLLRTRDTANQRALTVMPDAFSVWFNYRTHFKKSIWDKLSRESKLKGFCGSPNLQVSRRDRAWQCDIWINKDCSSQLFWLNPFLFPTFKYESGKCNRPCWFTVNLHFANV